MRLDTAYGDDSELSFTLLLLILLVLQDLALRGAVFEHYQEQEHEQEG
jgi:hypothetical protein